MVLAGLDPTGTVAAQFTTGRLRLHRDRPVERPAAELTAGLQSFLGPVAPDRDQKATLPPVVAADVLNLGVRARKVAAGPRRAVIRGPDTAGTLLGLQELQDDAFVFLL